MKKVFGGHKVLEHCPFCAAKLPRLVVFI